MAFLRGGFYRKFNSIHILGGDIRNLTILLLLSLSFGSVAYSTNIEFETYDA